MKISTHLAAATLGLLAAVPAFAQPVLPPAIPKSTLGQPNGVPQLDNSGLLPTKNIPLGVVAGTIASGETAPMVLGATRTGIGGSSSTNSGTGSPMTMARTRHILPGGASMIQPCWAGWNATPTEQAVAPTIFTVDSADVVAGGSGYAVGDSITESGSGGIRGAVMSVLSVSSGAVTKVSVANVGLYQVPLADGTSQSSTTGGGTGATFTFHWHPYAYAVRVGIEPTWSTTATQTFAGASAVVQGVAGLPNYAGTALSQAADVLVPVSGIACTNPMRVRVPVGGAIAVRSFEYGTGQGYGTRLFWGRSSTDADYVVSGTSQADNTIGGNIDPSTVVHVNTVKSPLPLMILARPLVSKPSVCAIGDSITWGLSNATVTTTLTEAANSGDTQVTVASVSGLYLGGLFQITGQPGSIAITAIDSVNNKLTISTALTAGQTIGTTVTSTYGTDTGDADNNKGWLERALASQYAVTNLATPSNQITYLFTASYGRTNQLAAIERARCSSVGVFLGINDFNTGGKTEAQVLAYEQQLVAELRAIPTVKRVFTFTNSPIVSVSGTTQTVTNPATTQVQARNADLRNGLLPNGTYSASSASDYANLYDFVLDTAVVVENGTTGMWNNLSLTGDGLHPSPLGHATIAAAVQANLVANLK